MEAIEAILTRRSIRKFKEDKVPDGIIHKVLECGFAAPTARNRRPLHFILLQDPSVLKELGEMSPTSTMVARSSFSVLVCGDLSLEERMQFIDQDGAAATENMLLAAHSLGLGAVWVGMPKGSEREDTARRACGIPDGLVPVSLIAFGYPDEVRDVPDRYDAAKVSKDRWGYR